MFSLDIVISLIFMIVLFVRQMFILKDITKINYAPLVVSVGVVTFLIHILLNVESLEFAFLLKESIVPLLVSVILYIIMNILHQTQQSQSLKHQEEFTFALVNQVSELKNFVADLEQRMLLFAQEDKKAQESLVERFEHEIKSLESIKTNQYKIFERFDEIDLKSGILQKEIKNLSEVKIPQIDSVVHKHIDILRVADQDHFNQLKNILMEFDKNKLSVEDELEEIKKSVVSMRGLSDEIAKSITRHTLLQLSDITKAFEGQIITLKTQAEGVKTSLLEGENRLEAIKTQSEMIMKQMVLSSNKMQELKEQNDGLYNIYELVKDLVKDIEYVKSEYEKSQAKLSVLAHDVNFNDNEHFKVIEQKIESLADELSKKVDESLEKLHEHYHIADSKITKNVQILSQQAKAQHSGYVADN